MGLVLGFLLVMAATNVGVVYYYQGQVQEDATTVDAAGQQRMLTQRITRFANLIAAGENSEANREALRAAVEKYQSNLDAMTEGGQSGEVMVAPVPDSARDELAAEREGWQPFKQHALRLLETDPGSEQFRTSLSYIRDNSDSLLATSDDLVKAVSRANQAQIAFMQRLLLGLFALNVLAVAVGAVGMHRTVSRPLEQLTRQAGAIADGDLEVEMTRPGAGVDDKRDEVAILAATLTTMRDNIRELIADAENARKEAEAARQEAEQLSDHLTATAERYAETMAACADGDLTRRLEPDDETEAMAVVAESFNEMVRDLEEVILEVAAFAEEVAASGEEVTASTEEVNAAADQIAKSVQEISTGAERQDETLQSVAEEMNTLSTTIEEMAASANQVAETAEKTADTGATARQATTGVIAEMETVEAESDAAVESMEQLQERMAEIEEITEFITDVAEQTNILALNANIEASRAGEAGEGFAVVADEVKSLAEETRDAAEEIEALVTDISDQTERTAQEVRETSDAVAESTDTVRSTVESLAEIATYAEETNTGIQEISTATEQQASSTNEVVSMVDEAAAIAEQTSQEASDAAGATEEQAASLSETTNSASSLASEADQLRELLDRFETDGSPTRSVGESGTSAADD